MKSQEWQSDAQRWAARHARMARVARGVGLTKPSVAPGAERDAVEGARYLMFANGAVLVASISGVGEAWHAPELRPVFAILVDHFTWSLIVSMMAWTGFIGVRNRIEHGAADARNQWGTFLLAMLALSFAVLSVLIIINAGTSIAAHLGVNEHFFPLGRR